MLETIKNIYQELVNIGFYPLITVTAFGVYYCLIQLLSYDKKKAAWIALIVCLIAQMSYVFPNGTDWIQDILKILFMTILQFVAAIGTYSFIEKYGLFKKMSDYLASKIGGKGKAKINDSADERQN